MEIRLEGKREGEESWWEKRAGRDPSVLGEPVPGHAFLAVSDLHTSCTTLRPQVQNLMHWSPLGTTHVQRWSLKNLPHFRLKMAGCQWWVKWLLKLTSNVILLRRSGQQSSSWIQEDTCVYIWERAVHFTFSKVVTLLRRKQHFRKPVRQCSAPSQPHSWPR